MATQITRFGTYAEGDAKLGIGALQDVDITSVEYGYEYDHKDVERVRRDSGAFTMGKKSKDGKLGLPLGVVGSIEKIAPNGDLALIKPFASTVQYVSDDNEIIVDVVIWKFKGNRRKVSSGGGEIVNEFDMHVVDIKLNVGL